MVDSKIDEIFEYIQSFSQEKTLITIGSGISAGEGISGMGPLAKYLLKSVQTGLDGLKIPDSDALDDWTTVKSALEDGMDLESSLSINDVSPVIEELIRSATYELIHPEDQYVFKEVFFDNRQLSLVPLLKQLTPTNSAPLTIITTNYDCLIEYACLSLGLKVDNLFYGEYIRKFSPEERGQRHLKPKWVASKKKNVFSTETDYVLLLKPHGSIDWFSRQGKGTYLLQPADFGIPDIITPGKGKWRLERREPFTSVYEMCNRAIDDASGYIFLGYGYNDEDLQDHYSHEENVRKPKLIVTMETNDQLNQLFQQSSECMLIQKKDNGAQIEWRRTNGVELKEFVEVPLWEIDYLARHVFQED